ncbi:MAG: riboflavin biosynthesis protein RibD, partial [Rhodospirillales bacterium]
SALSGSFMSDDLVDELAWFRAPSVMGGDSLPAIAPMAVNTPDNAPRFKYLETILLDGDRLERYLRISDKG